MICEHFLLVRLKIGEKGHIWSKKSQQIIRGIGNQIIFYFDFLQSQVALPEAEILPV